MVLAAVAPDIATLPIYLLVGREHARPFWIPHHADWEGVRAAHPVWSALWEVPHGLPFLFAAVVPLVLWLRLPKLAIAAYASHLLLDVVTHTGEWAVRPFFPWGPAVEGVTDAWAWPLPWMAVSWAVLLCALSLARRERA